MKCQVVSMRAWSLSPLVPSAKILLPIVLLMGCHQKGEFVGREDPKSAIDRRDLYVANLTLQSDSAEVRKTTGAPDSVTALSPSQHFQYYDYSVWHFGKYQLYFSKDHLLDGIRIVERDIRTARGLRVGDPIGRVRELYGRSMRDYDLPYQELYYTLGKGVDTGLVIDIDGDTVSSIYAGRFF